LKFGTLVIIYTRTSATYKNLSATGRLGKSAAPTFYFGTPLHISETNRAGKLKFGTLAVIYK